MQANDARRGTAIMYNNNIHIVMNVVHRTPGNKRAFVQMTLKNISSGEQLQNKFSSTEEVDSIYLEPKRIQYLYHDDSGFHVMDLNDYNTITLSDEFVGDDKYYLKENMELDLDVHEEKPVRLRLPTIVILKITESPPWVRGDSVSNNMKPAKAETGLPINVPIFIEEGTLVKVNTETGEYVGRE
jgi:elongation factor P